MGDIEKPAILPRKQKTGVDLDQRQPPGYIVDLIIIKSVSYRNVPRAGTGGEIQTG